MAHFAVSAVGADRPGIVAAVTAVFLQHGCNLEDSSMSILRGHFTMMLVANAPNGVTAKQLEEALTDAATRFDLVVAVRRIDDRVPASPAGERWNLAVYGADRPGIVHRVTQVLAENDVNIVDLTTHVIGEADQPVYAMLVDLTVPPGTDAELLARRLTDLADDLGVDCSLQRVEADVL
jgi:glycine cleavage system transcriptional repressor